MRNLGRWLDSTGEKKKGEKREEEVREREVVSTTASSSGTDGVMDLDVNDDGLPQDDHRSGSARGGEEGKGKEPVGFVHPDGTAHSHSSMGSFESGGQGPDEDRYQQGASFGLREAYMMGYENEAARQRQRLRNVQQSAQRPVQLPLQSQTPMEYAIPGSSSLRVPNHVPQYEDLIRECQLEEADPSARAAVAQAEPQDHMVYVPEVPAQQDLQAEAVVQCHRCHCKCACCEAHCGRGDGLESRTESEGSDEHVEDPRLGVPSRALSGGFGTNESRTSGEGGSVESAHAIESARPGRGPSQRTLPSGYQPPSYVTASDESE